MSIFFAFSPFRCPSLGKAITNTRSQAGHWDGCIGWLRTPAASHPWTAATGRDVAAGYRTYEAVGWLLAAGAPSTPPPSRLPSVVTVVTALLPSSACAVLPMRRGAGGAGRIPPPLFIPEHEWLEPRHAAGRNGQGGMFLTPFLLAWDPQATQALPKRSVDADSRNLLACRRCSRVPATLREAGRRRGGSSSRPTQGIGTGAEGRLASWREGPKGREGCEMERREGRGGASMQLGMAFGLNPSIHDRSAHPLHPAPVISHNPWRRAQGSAWSFLSTASPTPLSGLLGRLSKLRLDTSAFCQKRRTFPFAANLLLHPFNVDCPFWVPLPSDPIFLLASPACAVRRSD